MKKNILIIFYSFEHMPHDNKTSFSKFKNMPSSTNRFISFDEYDWNMHDLSDPKIIFFFILVPIVKIFTRRCLL